MESNDSSHGRGRAGVDSAAKLAHAAMLVEALRYGWSLTKFLDKWDSASEKHTGRERSDMRHIGKMQRLMAKGYLSHNDVPTEPEQTLTEEQVSSSIIVASSEQSAESVSFSTLDINTTLELRDLGSQLMEKFVEVRNPQGIIDFCVNAALRPIELQGCWFTWICTADLIVPAGSNKEQYSIGASCDEVMHSEPVKNHKGRLVSLLGDDNTYLSRFGVGHTANLKNARYVRCFRGLRLARFFYTNRTIVDAQRSKLSTKPIRGDLAKFYIEYVENVGKLIDRETYQLRERTLLGT